MIYRKRLLEDAEIICDFLESLLGIEVIDSGIDDLKNGTITIWIQNKLSEELITRCENLGMNEEIIRRMKYIFRRWFLEETREYLLANNYNPEGDVEEIDDILYWFKLKYNDPAILEIPQKIKSNYEAIEAFRSHDIGYMEIMGENFPVIYFYFEVSRARSFMRPFICRFEVEMEGNYVDDEDAFGLSIVRSENPKGIQQFHQIVNSVIERAFPESEDSPFPE